MTLYVASEILFSLLLKVVVSIQLPGPGEEDVIRRLLLKNLYSCSETADALILKRHRRLVFCGEHHIL